MFKTLLWELAKKLVADLDVQQTSEIPPAIQIGRIAIEKYWTGNHEIIKDFSDELVNHHAEEMREEVLKVAFSPDPRMANRERLTSCVMEFAQFQVLLIDPPPAEDPSGLRGQPGITGELKAHLLELAQKDRGLREFMHAFPTPKSVDGVRDPVLYRYRIMYAWISVYHMLRFAFDDVNHAEGKDWFIPFVAAMCAWQEDVYRESLGMPHAFEGSETEASKKALKMNSFMQFVLEGARFPDLEWRERSEEMVEERLAEAIREKLFERARGVPEKRIED
jgi:hypothetical protein